MAKQAVNLSISKPLLRRARALKLNLSRFFEAQLEQYLKRQRAEQGLEENRDAIASYNAHVEKHGVFSDGLRRF
jgi:antitoxin CcdA